MVRDAATTRTCEVKGSRVVASFLAGGARAASRKRGGEAQVGQLQQVIALDGQK